MPRARYILHSTPRLADIDLRLIRRTIIETLNTSIQQVHRHSSSRAGVYIGTGGTVLMDWRLAHQDDELAIQSMSELYTHPLTRSPSGSNSSFLETSIGAATLILIHQYRLERLEQNKRGTHHSNLNRSSSNSSSSSATHSRQHRLSRKNTEAGIHLIRHAIQVSVDEPIEDDGCEVLYGRAGLLYALLRIRSELSSSILTEDPIASSIDNLCSDENINTLVNDIVERGKLGSQQYARELQDENERRRVPPLMWSWHGKRYLGAAHGVAGILQILICTPPEIIAPHWDLVANTARWLVDIQLPDGNWPTKAVRNMFNAQDENEDTQLVQWCHGAPGLLIFLSSLLRRYRQYHSPSTLALPHDLMTSTRNAIMRGGELIYKRGLLRKGVGLCHGIGGNVYALLSVSDALDNGNGYGVGTGEDSLTIHDTRISVWLYRAVHLAQLATAYDNLTQRGQMNTPDRPYSLYEGLGGMCCAWAEIVRRLDRVMGKDGGGNGAREDMGIGHGLPGFDDLRILD
ncbi:hypothetical protein C8Q75DRAFT_747552 [Abortiporus biennis]|nr:hypothetical protein C8Q75DRAFT_747552 [Abortiporus biennis]